MRQWLKIRGQRLTFGILVAAVGLAFLPLVWFASNAAGATYSYLLLTRPTIKEVMGEYSVATSRGTAHLILRENGTFSEAISSSGKIVDLANGHWQNSSSNDDNAYVLFLSPHVVLSEDSSTSSDKGAFIAFYKSRIGKIYGNADPDVGPRFVKQ